MKCSQSLVLADVVVITEKVHPPSFGNSAFPCLWKQVLLLELSVKHPAGDITRNLTKTTQHYSHSSIVVVKGAMPYSLFFSSPL